MRIPNKMISAKHAFCFIFLPLTSASFNSRTCVIISYIAHYFVNHNNQIIINHASSCSSISTGMGAVLLMKSLDTLIQSKAY